MIAAPIQKSFFSWSPPLSLIWMYCLLHISSFLPQEATISSNPSDAISSRAALSILWLNHLSVLLWLTSNLWALPVFAWFGTLHWLEKQTLQATRFWETTRKLLLLVSDSVLLCLLFACNKKHAFAHGYTPLFLYHQIAKPSSLRIMNWLAWPTTSMWYGQSTRTGLWAFHLTHWRYQLVSQESRVKWQTSGNKWRMKSMLPKCTTTQYCLIVIPQNVRPWRIIRWVVVARATRSRRRSDWDLQNLQGWDAHCISTC